MRIEVKGHSGCKIDIFSNNSELFIEKSTNSPNYIKRLLEQAKKQEMAQHIESQAFSVPKVLSIKETPNSCSITMEYIYSQNYIEYFENCGLQEINHFINSIINYIELEIDKCKYKLVDPEVINNKINDIILTSNNNPILKNNSDSMSIIIDACNLIKQNCNKINIPIGICHGDMTFSNVLFSNTKYYLIDFLDSFIESPILDIVKIRQDTKFGWSKLMYLKTFDRIRLDIISNYIDSLIDSYFTKYEWYNNHYIFFQLLNFLRIIQYALDKEVVKYLNKTIKEITYEFNTNCSNSCR